MSDAPVESAPAEAPAAEAPVESAPAAEAPVAEAPVASDDPFDAELGDDAVFPRGYVEKLRKQGQTYREQMQEKAEQLARYEEVYGQYDAEDRDAWFSMAQEWARDPRAGAEMMQRIADAVLNEGKTPEEATEQVIAEDQVAAQVEQEANGMLTPEQVEKMIAERLESLTAQQEEQAREREIEQLAEGILSQVREAGYDPTSRPGQEILLIANTETNGDIAKAIEIKQAENQKIIDDYIAGKTANPSPKTAPDAGVLASQVPEVDTLEDAFKASRRFLEGISSEAG